MNATAKQMDLVHEIRDPRRWLMVADHRGARLLEIGHGEPYVFCRIGRPAGKPCGGFARRLAWILDSLEARGDYDELIIVANHRLMEGLMTHLTPRLSRTVVGAIETDLFRVTDQDLPGLLRQHGIA